MAERTNELFFKMRPLYYAQDEEFFYLEHPLSELLWVRAQGYAKDKNTDGVIPAKALRMLVTRLGEDGDLLAKDLVQAGLWSDNGDGTFTDVTYTVRQTTKDDQEAKRERKRSGGLASAHKRGAHAEKPSDDCPLCSTPDEQDPNTTPTGVEQVLNTCSTGSNQSTENRQQSTDNRGSEEIVPDGSAAADNLDEVEDEPHPDDVRICQHLADAIELRTQHAPKQPKSWLNDARLLRERGPKDWAKPASIDTELIIRAIDWAMSDGFWCTNILSPDALRRGWTRMTQQATEQKRTGYAPAAQERADANGQAITQGQAMLAALLEEENQQQGAIQ